MSCKLDDEEEEEKEEEGGGKEGKKGALLNSQPVHMSGAGNEWEQFKGTA